ncbi:MAG TPA: TIR domain-containing protein [Solirubrobacterales bacterium]|nr:TIR domain-containing protein [Solirubrobacterales bacterium]
MSDQKVFICYRRQETAAHAGRLYDAIVARFGEENVFMDVEMPPGVDFVERITSVVSGCVALIVVIGPSWAAAADGGGRRRLDDPADFVRLEVETGLRQQEVTPIPVLVSSARMPRQEELPQDLQPLARRNALELSEGRWNYDVGRLFGRLEELLPAGSGGAQPAPAPEVRSETPSDLHLVAEGTALAAVSAAAGRLLAEPILKSIEWDDLERSVGGNIATLTAYSVVAVVPVGVALAIWLALRWRRGPPGAAAAQGLLVGAVAGALSALFWGALVFPREGAATFHDEAMIQLGALALFGGGLGWLIGRRWGSHRTGAAVAVGASAAVLFQLVFVLGLNWENDGSGELVISYAITTAMVVAGTLGAMVALDRSATSSAAVGAR